MGFGYLLAGSAPLVMGLLLDVTGGYPVPLAVLLVAGVAQGSAIALIQLRNGVAPRPEPAGQGSSGQT
jgi:CP family cyanate transporter-like MFS transporter